MVGFLLALFLAGRRGRRDGINPADLFDAGVIALLAGIVGARIFYVISEWHLFRTHPLEIIRIDKGGLVFYGGVMGGAAALLVVVLRKGLPFRRTLDVVVSVLPLGHAFGRVGCFLNGCCYGHITSSWVGVRFPRVVDPDTQMIVGSPPFLDHMQRGLVDASSSWSLPVHATQLYAVGYNLAIFAILTLWLPRRWRAGEAAWLYAILYGSARFANEMLRVTPPVLFGLSIAQMFCVPLVIFGLVMLARERSKPRQPLPEPWHEPREG